MSSRLKAWAAFVAALFGAESLFEHEVQRRLAADNRGQLGQQTVIAALVVAIVASLAVIVLDQFDTSLGTPSSSALSTSQNDVLTGFGDMTSLIGPLFLVAIAAVIIGLVQRVRS